MGELIACGCKVSVDISFLCRRLLFRLKEAEKGWKFNFMNIEVCVRIEYHYLKLKKDMKISEMFCLDQDVILDSMDVKVHP